MYVISTVSKSCVRNLKKNIKTAKLVLNNIGNDLNVNEKIMSILLNLINIFKPTNQAVLELSKNEKQNLNNRSCNNFYFLQYFNYFNIEFNFC